MVLIPRAERERRVIESYDQGKTFRQIAQEIRISPRDIGLILKKASGQEKDKEASTAEQNENNNKSVSTQAFELFREGESPIEVAIALNLRQSETERLFKEFLRLNGWHKLARIHGELKDDIDPFVKLYQLCQIEGIGPKDVIKLLEIANNKSGRGLKGVQQRFESLKNEVKLLEDIRLDSKMDLRNLQNQIKALARTVDSLQLNSNEEQRKVVWLLEEKKALENFVKEFKSTDKEYEKIKQFVEEKANDFLSDKRTLLKLALLSLVRTIQSDPVKFNYIVNGIPTTAASAAARSSISGPYYYLLSQKQKNEIGEIYKRLLIDEAEKIYQELVTYLTDRALLKLHVSNCRLRL